MLWKERVAVKIAVCKNGHIGGFHIPIRQKSKKSCPRCKAGILTNCERCDYPIGKRVGVYYMAPVAERDLERPRHCSKCGRDFPWSRGNKHKKWHLGCRAWFRRHIKFKVMYMTSTLASIIVGLFNSICIVASRDGKVCNRADIVRIGVEGYKVSVKSKKCTHWMNMEHDERGWMCDCPEFSDRALWCRHVWSVKFTQRIRRVAQRCGLDGNMKDHGKEIEKIRVAEHKSSSMRNMKTREFRAEIIKRLHHAWDQYCLWEEYSNYEIEQAARIVDKNPAMAMYHAQQAMEKQIKAAMVYYAAFDDSFDPKDHRHDIFANRLGKEFNRLLNRDDCRNELKNITLGICVKPAKSAVLRYIEETPSLIAYGVGIDLGTELTNIHETLDPKRYYEYICEQLCPLQFQPSEILGPMRNYRSQTSWSEVEFKDNIEDLASAWEIRKVKTMYDFLDDMWTWRYYALYVHEDARYPSEFMPTYHQKKDMVKRWIFEAGFMISELQQRIRYYYSQDTYRDGDYGRRNMGYILDHGWYEEQVNRLVGNSYVHFQNP